MCSRGLLRTIIYNRPCDNSWISRDEKDRSIKIGNGGRAVGEGGGREGSRDAPRRWKRGNTMRRRDVPSRWIETIENRLISSSLSHRSRFPFERFPFEEWNDVRSRSFVVYHLYHHHPRSSVVVSPRSSVWILVVSNQSMKFVGFEIRRRREERTRERRV